MNGSGHTRATAMRILATILWPLVVFACSEGRAYVWVHSLPAEQTSSGTETIRAADKLLVFIRGQDPATNQVTVQEDGSIVVAPAGRVVVAGLTAEEASKRVAAALGSMLVNPHAVVTITETRLPTVTVIGEVKSPGIVQFRPDRGVLAVLAEAGGLTDFADRDGIYVVRSAPKPLRVRFRYEDLVQGEPHSTSFRLRDGDTVTVD